MDPNNEVPDQTGYHLILEDVESVAFTLAYCTDLSLCVIVCYMTLKYSQNPDEENDEVPLVVFINSMDDLRKFIFNRKLADSMHKSNDASIDKSTSSI